MISHSLPKRVQQFLTILGWDPKQKRGSCEPPARDFNCLGVRFVFTADPEILAANKPSPIEKIRSMYEKLAQRDSMSGSEMAILRGRVLCSTSQRMGRIGLLADGVLNKLDPCASYGRTDQDVRDTARWWLDTVEKAPRREVLLVKGICPPSSGLMVFVRDRRC